MAEPAFLRGHVALQMLTDRLVGGVSGSQPHPAGDAMNMSIHRKHTAATTREQQDAVGSLRTDAVHVEQRRPHRLGVAVPDELVEAHFAAVLLTDTLGQSDNALGFLVVEV